LLLKTSSIYRLSTSRYGDYQAAVTSLQTSMKAGMIAGMGEMRKITIEVPEQLIASVQDDSKRGRTETVREALELMRQTQVQNQARKLRGKVKFSMTLDELRHDRE